MNTLKIPFIVKYIFLRILHFKQTSNQHDALRTHSIGFRIADNTYYSYPVVI